MGNNIAVFGGRRTKNHPKAQLLFGGNKTQGCLRLSFWQRDVKGNPEKYGIRSDKPLRNWMMKENGHENLKSSGTGGTSTMTKGRKTTYDERVEIVRYCIEHEMDYAQAAEKYQVSYQ
jgi:transposase